MHVCITGGADGLGRELSKCFYSRGWRVTVIDRKAPEAFCEYIFHDFLVPLQKKISCDILLINHAYFHGFTSFYEMSCLEIDEYLQAHLVSVIHLIRTAECSRIVYINSVLSITAFPNTSLYSSVKAFMHSFLHSLRREGASVLLVYPYKMNTSLFSSVYSPYVLSAKETAISVYKASLNNSSTIYIPRIFRIAYLLSLLPLRLQDLLLSLIYRISVHKRRSE